MAQWWNGRHEGLSDNINYNSMEPYADCKIFGPYKSSKDGRLRIVASFPNGTKKTVSYPKYIKEIELGRYLLDNETIDHIDGNFLNNDLSNLRVIDRREHAILDAERNDDVEVTCSYCGKKFKIKGSKLCQRNRPDRGFTGYFCSKKCVGKYGAEVQNGRIIPQEVNKVNPTKFKLKESAQDKNLDV